MSIAQTPTPPYYAVIFTSLTRDDLTGYAETAARMVELAQQQEGFLGVESAREGLGITVSYWRDLGSISAWRQQAEHLQAQAQGKARWYSAYTTRIARVERDYQR
nr:antibiotic biosynthesis monooxygenase [Halioxenophilus sp. WMMB6]